MSAARDGQQATDADLVLFVTGDAPRSRRARHNLARALDDIGLGAGSAREVDLMREPEQSLTWGVFASPALMCVVPDREPAFLYGDLSDADGLRDFLQDLRPGTGADASE